MPNAASELNSNPAAVSGRGWVTVMLFLLFFVYAGDAPPMVNEAHYLVKAKNFWQPDWCAADLFASSGKAHTTYYAVFGWPTKFLSLTATAWIGRVIGWWMLAVGLRRICDRMFAAWWASLAVATLWIAGIEYGNLAGEWVVGGTEAKVPAYGLVLMGIAELVDRKWNRVWVYLGAASAFHVLTGGWAVVAAAFAWLLTEFRRDDRRPFWTRWLFVGGALSLFGLVPAIWLTIGVDPSDATAAARIYSYFRIRHHLLPADFHWTWYLRHLVVLTIVAVGAWMDWRRSPGHTRLFSFTLGAVAVAGCGLVVGALPAVAPDLAAKLLRYYWFRLSDAVVPLMMAIVIMQWMVDVRGGRRIAAWIALMLATGLVGYSTYDRVVLAVPPSASNRLLGWDASLPPQAQQQAWDDWIRVCQWARDSSDPGEVFLTPRHQQTFKWYAQRSEVVNWKDVPQDAASLTEWNRRFAEIFPARLGTIRVTIGYQSLRQFREKYHARFMIVDRRVVGDQLPLIRIYPQRSEDNATFAVYELPR
ncbi:hypothetical protein K227x_48970 [Rubripirellula lacrimiformis]|uniref:DUF6798 domain-containing protein n=2 Tax=Rubripirellula lacrimiformis TaxID=1930273 RepID=A0A517NH69_9BACT|nr:hypothetical protein K227x_48970 [Rubripirellula lacrimiformis]